MNKHKKKKQGKHFHFFLCFFLFRLTQQLTAAQQESKTHSEQISQIRNELLTTKLQNESLKREIEKFKGDFETRKIEFDKLNDEYTSFKATSGVVSIFF